MSTSGIHNGSLIDWAVATQTLPGQEVSGDLYVVRPFLNGVLVAVVDGLGHGIEATAAARAAVSVFQNHAADPILELINRCHEALLKTRGAVITVGSFNLSENTLTWLGVGNVEGRLLYANRLAAPKFESVLLRGGVVGYQMPVLQASVVSVNENDVLVLASDGIHADFLTAPQPTEAPQEIADRILKKHFKGTDDAVVLVARYLGARTK